MYLNNESYMIRYTFIKLNPIEFIYYSLLISLHKCNESCKVVDDLSKTKYANVERFNIITRIS